MILNVVLPLILLALMIGAVLATFARDFYLWVSGREAIRNAVVYKDATVVRKLPERSPHLAHDQEALFCAIFQSRDEALVWLLERGADLRTTLQWGGAALHIAARYGTIESVKAILAHGADIDDDRGGTPLHWAADQGRLDVVELLLERGADAKRVPIAEIGMSGFKPKFATGEEFERIRQRIAEAQAKAA